MTPADDSALLRQYAESQCDEAFAALVSRHVNLVYSLALRHVGDQHGAQEVTQTVFITLAKKAGQLRHDKALSSWLFQATRLTASNFLRSENRRHRREQEAHMQSVANKLGEEIWPRIAPLLDSAVANLSESDREAIVLRYYEGKTLREVGAALSASEDAAEKRVARALDKLRAFFVKRGITVGATGLAAIITANAVHAAPEGLAATVSTAALVGTPVAAASIITTTTKAIAMTILQKQLTATIVAALLVCAITTYVATRDSAPKARGNSALAGKWQTEDKTETMDFLSDGTCQGNDKYGRTVAGNFAFVDASHIRLQLKVSTVDKARGTIGVDNSSGICKFEVQRDLLTLSDESGSATHYRRAR